MPSQARHRLPMTRRDWLRMSTVSAAGLSFKSLLQAEGGGVERGKATAKR